MHPLLRLTVLLGCLCAMSLLYAQDATAPADIAATLTQPASSTTLTAIADRASATEKLLEELRSLLVAAPATHTDEPQLDNMRQQIQALETEEQALLANRAVSLEQLRTLQSRWQFFIDDISRHIAAYKEQTRRFETSLQKLATEKAVWLGYAREMEENTALAEAQASKTQALTNIEQLQKSLSEPLQVLLEQQKNWQELIDRAQLAQKQLRDRTHTVKKNQLTTSSQPLWQLRLEEFRINANTRLILSQQFANAREYLRHYPALASAIYIVFFSTLLLIWRLRVRQKREQQQQMGIGLKLPLLSRPFSTAVAMAAGLALLIYPNQPQLVSNLFAMLLIIPVARLGTKHIPKTAQPLAWLVSLIFVINNLSIFTEAIPALERLWFICCAIIVATVCIQVLNALKAESPKWQRLRFALWVSLAITLASLAAGLAGFANLDKMLITAISNAAYTALCVFVVTGVINDIAVAVLYLSALADNLLVSRNRHRIIKQVNSTALLIGALIWVYFTLNQFLLFDPLWDTLVTALTWQPPLGKLQVTLGSVLSIVITIWLSYKISQLLRFIFIEDIAPRAQLARGVPDAVATLMHYVIILIGFLTAMSVAGIDLSKLAIMAGALGIGIGIGLQDVVNNFSSGLIILFEQNIKQGDLIQSGSISGRVVRTGLRSSIVRTGDGAEVIIPNGQLASSQVINWTHSTQQRRLNLPVSVAYGSDPDLVLATLIEIANDDPDVLNEPAPTAYFIAFGPSSLDVELRAWVRNSDHLSSVQTRLFIHIIKRFDALGIAMPFPQQDVHIKTWPGSTTSQ